MITWLDPGDPFPPVECACGAESSTPGLLAASQHLDLGTLRQAYARGIFPWYSAGQPVLWWSTDPRMVLAVSEFRIHHSFRKQLARFRRAHHCEVRIDSSFASVIGACADVQRSGQHGTWIVPAMQQAYISLHHAGLAHSVETWIDGQLVGGLYCVALGRAVFGESMFSRVSGASKIALAALVALCRAQGVLQIDCQQNTAHLASLGAREIARRDFCAHVELASNQAAPIWEWRPVYWNQIAT